MNIKRTTYILLGLTCVALGAIGVVLPGLPTTPFLLAASWLFYRSSPRLQAWLLASRLGVYIRSYHKRGGMRRKSKWMVVALMTLMVSCSVLFFIEVLWLRVVVAIAGLVGVCVVLFAVPEAKEDF